MKVAEPLWTFGWILLLTILTGWVDVDLYIDKLAKWWRNDMNKMCALCEHLIKVKSVSGCHFGIHIGPISSCIDFKAKEAP